MNKPLSETHPTLYNEGKEENKFITNPDLIKAIQSFTVDSAEHERVLAKAKNDSYTMGCLNGEDLWREEAVRLKKQYGDCYESLAEANVEISRLKKELEEHRWYKKSHDDTMRMVSEARIEGERRAIEQARLACWNNIKEIPLGEHGSTYNSAIKIFVSMFGQHPKELGLGEESTDNNNYTNKEERI